MLSNSLNPWYVFEKKMLISIPLFLSMSACFHSIRQHFLWMILRNIWKVRPSITAGSYSIPQMTSQSLRQWTWRAHTLHTRDYFPEKILPQRNLSRNPPSKSSAVEPKELQPELSTHSRLFFFKSILLEQFICSRRPSKMTNFVLSDALATLLFNNVLLLFIW